MATFIDLAESRGITDIGWLYGHHTFSFSNYYNPNRMSFGTLRVLNDDVIKPDKGFGTHSHNNMEIISIPLNGALRHRDSMGHEFVLKAGEIQVMSAGTGITHSEFNDSDSEDASLLQIWVLPKEQNLTPSYNQKALDRNAILNKFELIIAPKDGNNNDVLTINQDAYFSIAVIDTDESVEYTKYQQDNGIYFFVIDGAVELDTQVLNKRDGIGITDLDDLKIIAKQKSKVLCMEVPM
ncbi:hypothetical protein A9Q79_02730 [Methylophaga sp. 42_25_T18]|nr:hypothetical protein A9Q79_02730 [Methylophaga sp. 42_25_T18]